MKAFYNGHPVHIGIQTLLDFKFNISSIFDKWAETVRWKLLIAVIKQNQHVPGGHNFSGCLQENNQFKDFLIFIFIKEMLQKDGGINFSVFQNCLRIFFRVTKNITPIIVQQQI